MSREPSSAAHRYREALGRSGHADPPPEPPPPKPKPKRRNFRVVVPPKPKSEPPSATRARPPEPVPELLRDDRGREAVRIGNRVYRPHWQDLDPDQITKF